MATVQPIVERRKLPQIPGYLIGRDGSIWSRKLWREWREMRQAISTLGYKHIRLRLFGKNKTLSVHRLVALAFVENPGALPEVNHRNGNKQDNCADNLEWSTKGDNIKHAYRTGLRRRPIGELGSASKLTDNDVRAIRIRLQNGESQRSIASVYGVSSTAIKCVKLKRTWSHVT